MILFLVSLFFVAGFAYFAANLLDSKNIARFIIYFFLSAFSNIVLTFEILSLFSKISVAGALLCNFVLFVAAFLIWLCKKRPVVKFDLKKSFIRLKKVLLLDKTLLITGICFMFMLAVSIFLVSFLPSVDSASKFYHVLRSLFWIEHGTLNHFDIADARALVFPIDSELLYTWVILFLKKDIWLAGVSLGAYFVYVTALYGILRLLSVSLRRILWVIFVVSAFPATIAYLSSTETNIIVAALVLSGIYLYMVFLKNHDYKSLFMSTLAFSLAAGTKTSAFLMVPAITLWMIIAGVKFKSKNFFKSLSAFLLFFVVNFILFASYNYILNFINYGNVISNSALSYGHSNLHGFKGFLFNLVNYIFMFFQFPEYEKFLHLSDSIYFLKKFIIKSSGLIPYIGQYSNDSARMLIEAARGGFGLLGVIVFLPSCFVAFSKLFCKKSFKHFILNSFSLIFIISFLIMAYSLVYMSFNIRFIVTFAMVAAPVFYYSYTRNCSFYKSLVCAIMIISFVYIPLNITDKNVFSIVNLLKEGKSFSQIREIATCSGISNPDFISSVCFLKDKIKQTGKPKRYLYFSYEGEPLLALKMLQFDGYRIDTGLIENAATIDYSVYDIIVTLKHRQSSTLFKNSDKIISVFYRENGVTCQYNEPDGSLVIENENSKPYISYCKISYDFFKSRHFRLKEVWTYTQNINRIENNYNFYVYENTLR